MTFTNLILPFGKFVLITCLESFTILQYNLLTNQKVARVLISITVWQEYELQLFQDYLIYKYQ